MQAQEPTLTSISGCINAGTQVLFNYNLFHSTLLHFINAGSQVMKACLYREYVLFQRNAFVFKFKAVQVRSGSFIHERGRFWNEYLSLLYNACWLYLYYVGFILQLHVFHVFIHIDGFILYLNIPCCEDFLSRHNTSFVADEHCGPHQCAALPADAHPPGDL